MKKYFSYIFFSLLLSTFSGSCDKEPASKSFAPFYRLTVNGSKKSVPACGTSDHVAQYLKDTAIYSSFGCGGQRAGFYLKGGITDGTYHLDQQNKAWYEEDAMRYTTDNFYQGTLTVRTGYFQVTGGAIPYIEGEISFDAIDKSSGKTIKVTYGKYLLKKYQY